MTSKDWTMWDPRRPDDAEAGVVNWFLASGTAGSALSPPGAAFHYSDTGYVVLGLVVEKLTGSDLHAQLRRRIFDPLGMQHTYLAYATDPDPAPWQDRVSDCYIGDIPAVSTRVNMSYDRGGGGVVSTVGDMSTFMKALMRGALFARPATLVEMTRWQVVAGIKAPRKGVGLGVFAESTPRGIIALGHSGAYGAKMYYAPERGLFVCGTVNQRVGVPYYWWTAIVDDLQ